MLRKTNELYEGLTKDVFLVKQGSVAIRGELSDEIKEGIEQTLDSVNLTEDEEKILDLRYNCNMLNSEIAELTQKSSQKIRAEFAGVFNKIRCSSKFIHFFRGTAEGDAAAFYAESLIRRQLGEHGGWG